MTDRELFELPEDYVESTGLDKITFEVPFELFTKILKGYGHKLAWEDYRQIKIHPSTRTKKTVGQCQFLFSIWMNDHLKPAIKPSTELQKGGNPWKNLLMLLKKKKTTLKKSLR